jgi:hypothetical protein
VKIFRQCYDTLKAIVAVDVKRGQLLAKVRAPRAGPAAQDAVVEIACEGRSHAGIEMAEGAEVSPTISLRIDDERLYSNVAAVYKSLLRAIGRGDACSIARAFGDLPATAGTGDPVVYCLWLRYNKEFKTVRKGCLSWQPHCMPVDSLCQLKDPKATLVGICASLKVECPTLHAATRLASDATFAPGDAFDAALAEEDRLAKIEAQRKTGILSMDLCDDDSDEEYLPGNSGDDLSVSGSEGSDRGDDESRVGSDEEEQYDDDDDSGDLASRAHLDDDVEPRTTRSMSSCPVEEESRKVKVTEVLMRNASKQPGIAEARLAILIGNGAFQRHKHLSATVGIIATITTVGNLNIFERGLLQVLAVTTAANTADGYLRSMEFDPMEKMPACREALLRHELEQVRTALAYLAYLFLILTTLIPSIREMFLSRSRRPSLWHSGPRLHAVRTGTTRDRWLPPLT